MEKMKIVFEKDDIEFIYHTTATESNQGYLNEKLTKLNEDYKTFYGYLDLANRDTFNAMVAIPSDTMATIYANSILEEECTIQYSVPHYDNGWVTRVVFTIGDSYTEHHFDVWHNQGAIYGEW